MSIPREDQSSIPYGPFPYVEFTLKAVIEHGIATTAADPSLIDKLFVKLPKDVRDDLKAYLKAHPHIEVKHNFPRAGTKLPIISIVLATETEDSSKETLAYFIDELTDENGDVLEDVTGQAMRSQYNVMIFTHDRDFTIHFYNLIKAFITINIEQLLANGVHEMQLSGSDFRIEDDNYFPEFAYSRMLSVNALHFDVVPISETVLRALRVTMRTDPDTVISSTEITTNEG